MTTGPSSPSAATGPVAGSAPTTAPAGAPTTADESYPFTSQPLNEDQWSAMMGAVQPDGITNHGLAPSLGTGREVVVGPGVAFISGFCFRRTVAAPVALAANTGSTARVDTIVLRLDQVAGTISLEVVPGKASGPVTPPAGDVPIAQVTIAASALAATALVDTRRTANHPLDLVVVRVRFTPTPGKYTVRQTIRMTLTGITDSNGIPINYPPTAWGLVEPGPGGYAAMAVRANPDSVGSLRVVIVFHDDAGIGRHMSFVATLFVINAEHPGHRGLTAVTSATAHDAPDGAVETITADLDEEEGADDPHALDEIVLSVTRNPDGSYEAS